jgi:DNA-binding transcriptional MerR regulator
MDTPKEDEPRPDGLYPIRTVSALTGVNPVTLRAWERRYGLIQPQRTPKGHRLYSEDDVAQIRQVLRLLDQGIPISQARHRLESGPLPAPLASAPGEDPWAADRGNMLGAIARFDAGALEGTYNDALSLYPVGLVDRLLITPLLADLRQRRETQPVAAAEAHFFHAFLRNKLGARFHHQSALAHGPRIMAADLPGEQNEIELLLFALGAVTHGYRVVLLGANMPLEPLPLALERSQCKALVLFGSLTPSPALISTHLKALAAATPVPVLVGGGIAREQAEALSASGSVPLPTDPSAALETLDEALRQGKRPRRTASED